MSESGTTGRGGGYLPGPLPPFERVVPDLVMSPQHSLERWIVRIHNQGNSNSCLGQTLATIMEITQAARNPGRPRLWFSSGYVWNQVNGGCDCAAKYVDACALLQSQGNARHKLFPYDGPELTQEFRCQPDARARADARRYRISSWHSIRQDDRQTMRAEIVAGLPLAVAIPVYDDFYYARGGSLPVIDATVGKCRFWHVVTAVGYTGQGLIILNSWGSGWGKEGRAVLTWNFLDRVGAAVVVCKRPWSPHQADALE